MKKWKILILLSLLIACGDRKENDQKEEALLKPESTGRINHVVVVVSPNHWKGNIGKAFQEILSDPIPGLPQPEYVFNVSTTPPQAFEKLFKRGRNLLVLQLSDQKVFHISKNKYAKPQTILVAKAPTEEALISLIQEKKETIINAFRDEDLKSIQLEHRQHQKKTKLQALKGLKANMVIPTKYNVVMDTLGSFLWMRSHIAGGIAVGDQTNNILVYQAEMFKNELPVLNQIIKNRDSIGKKFIRGNDVDTMYMITEAARTPLVRELKINGYKAYETKGTWEVFGAYNAGPFINYSIVDEKNNRILVAEGFNYAPSVNKRDFVFELEAILKTTQLLD